MKYFYLFWVINIGIFSPCTFAMKSNSFAIKGHSANIKSLQELSLEVVITNLHILGRSMELYPLYKETCNDMLTMNNLQITEDNIAQYSKLFHLLKHDEHQLNEPIKAIAQNLCCYNKRGKDEFKGLVARRIRTFNQWNVLSDTIRKKTEHARDNLENDKQKQ